MYSVDVVRVGRAGGAGPSFGCRVGRDHLAGAAHGLRLAATRPVDLAVLICVGRAGAARPPRRCGISADLLTLRADRLRNALVIVVSARAVANPVVVCRAIDVVATVAYMYNVCIYIFKKVTSTEECKNGVSHQNRQRSGRQFRLSTLLTGKRGWEGGAKKEKQIYRHAHTHTRMVTLAHARAHTRTITSNPNGEVGVGSNGANVHEYPSYIPEQLPLRYSSLPQLMLLQVLHW